ncbi:Signal transduction histidine kinase [Streptoalloteichus tenebrarius]|uniref:Signal transduction histidine kinase n=1 Tax=Streptoalloteichus tenebrarius (strain ATCC 17920 / DSM 40477 / JCM 4838 / CBS 697.72 / NBRC 16177 / NCIMB 11028 / NRRL B-12390 / A12253. 1 / ISP 5477) TaxID=1933 RepID=A0ABT1HTG3_STRSD|nr:sensor histidine kinase [Streptoalloteichus tenebrarius]MCP2258811.1 Signal transduction histidine kinase [Streptoalloteichus tenebrarius]BFE99508.1 sensor histidine kinase [Streptoalloteichus tenebrarius]
MEPMDSLASGDRGNAWTVRLRTWDSLWIASVILCALGLVALPPALSVRTAVAAGAVVVASLLYVVWGRRLLDSGDGSSGYLFLLTAAWSVAVAAAPIMWLAAMSFYAQAYALVAARHAHIAALTLSIAGSAGVASTGFGWNGERLVAGAAIALSAMICVTFMGWLITRIIAQSHERQHLIEELLTTRAELENVSHERGVLAERQRMAQEIHDTLAQGFTSLRMVLEAMETELDRDPAAARRYLTTAYQVTADSLAQARALVAVGAAPQLHGSPLPEAIERLLTSLGDGPSPVKTALTVTGSPRPLPVDAEVALLRAAQELVANVRKHAQAASVEVELCYTSSQIVLQVSDNGRGFDTNAPHNGYGLKGIQDRLDNIGGNIAVWSSPGAGTAVTATVHS